MSEVISTEEAIPLLDELVTRFADRLEPGTAEAFESMRESMGDSHIQYLSPKQRQWIQDVAVRFDLIADRAANQWSSASPAAQARMRGRDVPTPAVLLDRPLAPPGRRAR